MSVARSYLVATRYLAASGATDRVTTLLRQAEVELKKLRAWGKGFDPVLRSSLQTSRDLPSGYVWQDRFVDYWEPFDPIERRVVDIAGELEGLGLDEPGLKALTVQASQHVYPPRGARIEDAIKDPEFFEDAERQIRIAYTVKNLTSWHRHFMTWVEGSIQGLDSTLKASRKTP